MPDPNSSTQSATTSQPKQLFTPEQLAKQKQIEASIAQFNLGATNVSDQIKGSILKNSLNPYKVTEQRNYDPDVADNIRNFHRFSDSHMLGMYDPYTRLGYNPWRNNDLVYNQNTSKLGDISRAVGTTASLIPKVMWSSMKSTGRMLTGNEGIFDSNTELDNLLSNANIQGGSTRGGVTGFTSNLTVNLGFMGGIVGEALLETAPLALLGQEGLATVRAGKFLKDLGEGFKAVTGVGKLGELAKNYKTSEGIWDAVKATGKFINPLAETTQAIQTSKGLTDLAKASKTAGAFYRDVQAAHFAVAEAKTEGAGAARETEEAMIRKFREQHPDREPTAEEWANIQAAAVDAGSHTTLWNVPMIMLTNKVTLEPLMAPFRGGAEYALKNGVKFLEKEGVGFVEATFKNSLLHALKPKNIAKSGLKYFAGNLAEGGQETIQEIISGTAKDYYSGLYNSKNKGALDYSIGQYQTNSVWDALAKNVADQFSGQGFETFASGFLMGGLVKLGAAPVSATTSIVKDYRNSGQLSVKEYKQKRSEYAKSTLEALNKVYADPLKYFGANIINYSNGTAAVDKQVDSAENGAKKDWMDAENQNLMSHVVTALQTGTYDVFTDKLKAMESMTPQAIEEAYGVDGKEALFKLSQVISRAESVKTVYDAWDNKFPNPFNPSLYKKGTGEYNAEAYAQASWEAAKRWAVFNHASIGENAKRVSDIVDSILETPQFAQLSSVDISNLFHPNTIKSEIKLLEDELSVMNSGIAPTDKVAYNMKKTKLNRLSDLYSALNEYYIDQHITGKADKMNQKRLHKAFHDYMGTLATQQTNVLPITQLTLDNAFQKFLDIHDLKQENLFYSDVVNVLANPKGFIDQQKRLQETFKGLYEAKSEIWKKAIKNVHEDIEKSSFLKDLHSRGIVLDDDGVQAVKDKKVPKSYFDLNAGKLVDERDFIAYSDFEKSMKDFYSIVEEDKEEAPTETPVETPQQTKEEAPPQTQKLTIEPHVLVNIQDRINAVKNGQELEELEEELMAMMADIVRDEIENDGVASGVVEEMLNKKRAELESKATPENLTVGNVVLMNDDGWGKMIVTRKTKKEITFKKIGDPNTKLTVPYTNITMMVKFKYSEEMPIDIPITPTDKKTADLTAKTDQKFLQDLAELERLKNEAFENEDRFQKEFLDNLGCAE